MYFWADFDATLHIFSCRLFQRVGWCARKRIYIYWHRFARVWFQQVHIGSATYVNLLEPLSSTTNHPLGQLGRIHDNQPHLLIKMYIRPDSYCSSESLLWFHGQNYYDIHCQPVSCWRFLSCQIHISIKLLPHIFSQFLEEMVNCMIRCLSSLGLYLSVEFGYLTYYSTETLLFAIHMISSMHKGKVITFTLFDLDLSASFDTIECDVFLYLCE